MNSDADLAKIAALPYPWEKLDGKTLLISGATGFLGSALIKTIELRNRLFGNDIRVTGISRRPPDGHGCVRFIQADLSVAGEIDTEADYVLHLASNTHPEQYASDPVGTIKTNVYGADNLLQLAVRRKSERFLLASSVEIYGDCPPCPVDEKYCGYIDCNTARAGYNESKRLAESLARSYESRYGTEVVTVRLARCFGPDFTKRDTKVMAQFLRDAAAGRDITLRSEGKQRFSYCYYADAVSGIIAVLLAGKSGEAYNVADDDEGMNLKQFAEYIAGLAGVKTRTEIAPQKGTSAAVNALLDCGKLKKLGWKPQFTVREALENTYEILKSNGVREEK